MTDNGEGPIDDPEAAKERAKVERDKPEHAPRPDDLRDTVADADLDDPDLQAADE